MIRVFKLSPPATHMSLLFTCMSHTDGPVLEFSTGMFSTAITSAFSIGRRFVRTVESHKPWYDMVAKIDQAGCELWRKEHGGTHELLYVKSYDDVVVDDHDWDIVFLDQHPPERRGVDALRLRDRCRLMILHDAWQVAYKTDVVFKTFRYCLTDRRWPPWTCVGSDQPLDWLQELIPELDDFRGPHLPPGYRE